MKLELVLATDDNSTNVAGEIFNDPLVDPPVPPVVNWVMARNTASALFALTPGTYAYHFSVGGNGGKFTLTLRSNEGDGKVLGTRQYDTEYGFYGRTFVFTVGA
jgi:hypothetical protein